MEEEIEGNMESNDFIESIINGQINKDMQLLMTVQKENMEIMQESSKIVLENYGKIYDEIKTKDIRQELERSMSVLAKVMLDNEKEIERLENKLKMF